MTLPDGICNPVPLRNKQTPPFAKGGQGGFLCRTGLQIPARFGEPPFAKGGQGGFLCRTGLPIPARFARNIVVPAGIAGTQRPWRAIYIHLPVFWIPANPRFALHAGMTAVSTTFGWFPSSGFTAIKLSRHSGMDRRNPDCRDANNAMPSIEPRFRRSLPERRFFS